ncbi:hypothetical protein [Paenibacillus endoradicis]|uniref:hypothetical protein n=1 Tax=Paenibacillus endoradicis TaxID=2972487 RepID=UPI0021592513|nr:hypothetical protein [Paenibacillus endoradicis]
MHSQMASVSRNETVVDLTIVVREQIKEPPFAEVLQNSYVISMDGSDNPIIILRYIKIESKGRFIVNMTPTQKKVNSFGLPCVTQPLKALHIGRSLMNGSL